MDSRSDRRVGQGVGREARDPAAPWRQAGGESPKRAHSLRTATATAWRTAHRTTARTREGLKATTVALLIWRSWSSTGGTTIVVVRLSGLPTTRPDGTQRTSYDQCSDYGTWGEFATAYYDSAGHVETLWEDDGYRPQEACQGTACWSPGDWISWCWQATASDNPWVVDITPQCQHYGFPTDAALQDALLAVAAKYPKTTCMVATAGTVIVAVWTKGKAGKWLTTGLIVAGVSCALLFE